MSGPGRRLLVAGALGVLLLGPALALALVSLLAISREGDRLAADVRSAREARLRRGAALAHGACTDVVTALAAAAATADPVARAAALRALPAGTAGLAARVYVVGPDGREVAAADLPGLVMPPDGDPGPGDTADALAPGWAAEFGSARDPAEAAARYARAAAAPAAAPGLRARALVAAARAALTAERAAEALRFADLALGDALRAGDAYVAYHDEGGEPLVWAAALAKVRALARLAADPASPWPAATLARERTAAVDLLAAMLVRDDAGVPPAASAAWLALAERHVGGELTRRAATYREAQAAAAAARGAVADALSGRAAPSGLLCAATRPLQLLAIAPVPAAAGGGHLAAVLGPEAITAAFARAVSGLAPPADEAYHLLGPDGGGLPGQAALPPRSPDLEVALPAALGVLRAAAWGPADPATAALGALTRRAYLGLAVATVVAFAGGLFLFARVLRRELRLTRAHADFLASITHELRTPLTSIQMFVETLLLNRVQGPEEARECLEVIGREAGRLRRMIDRVLAFARTDRGDRAFTFRAEAVADLVQGAERLLLAAEPRERAPVESRVPPDCPPVRADREAVEEVLLNLLTNAAKYGSPGMPVRLEATARDGAVALAVTDQGMGVAPSEAERIFEGFYRGAAAREKHIPGMGIGLALARRIARAHGGDLTVQSTPGAGSTFTLTLPRADGPSGAGGDAWTRS